MTGLGPGWTSSKQQADAMQRQIGRARSRSIYSVRTLYTTCWLAKWVGFQTQGEGLVEANLLQAEASKRGGHEMNDGRACRR